MIKCIAIDDEPMALEVIKDYASKTPFIDLKATFVNTQSAIKFLLENENITRYLMWRNVLSV